MKKHMRLNKIGCHILYYGETSINICNIGFLPLLVLVNWCASNIYSNCLNGIFAFLSLDLISRKEKHFNVTKQL